MVPVLISKQREKLIPICRERVELIEEEILRLEIPQPEMLKVTTNDFLLWGGD